MEMLGDLAYGSPDGIDPIGRYCIVYSPDEIDTRCDATIEINMRVDGNSQFFKGRFVQRPLLRNLAKRCRPDDEILDLRVRHMDFNNQKIFICSIRYCDLVDLMNFVSTSHIQVNL